MTEVHPNIVQGIEIIAALGLPRAQQNERSALCLLALLNIGPNETWIDGEQRLIGITPIMEFSKNAYGRIYAPNSRETFRRQTMHQFVDAGIAQYNPDDPSRAVNSPKAVYQIDSETLAVIKTFSTIAWDEALKHFLDNRETLVERYAKEREWHMVPVHLATGEEILLSPGAHSELIKMIIEEFAPQFVPGGVLVYAGDTGDKMGYIDEAILYHLGVEIDWHGKMPDVVLYFPSKHWLILIESVTSHGPVDGKRHEELEKLFQNSSAGLVYVSAFPNKQVMSRYLSVIAWETEVWIADNPTHMIHFNGERFLGPY